VTRKLTPSRPGFVVIVAGSYHAFCSLNADRERRASRHWASGRKRHVGPAESCWLLPRIGHRIRSLKGPKAQPEGHDPAGIQHSPPADAAGIRARDITRTRRERLPRHGFLQEASSLQGLVHPESPGRSERREHGPVRLLLACCRRLPSRRVSTRIGALSPEQSLSLSRWELHGSPSARSAVSQRPEQSNEASARDTLVRIDLADFDGERWLAPFYSRIGSNRGLSSVLLTSCH
jgi:hypothetical protein